MVNHFQHIARSHLCISCGACTYASSGAVSMQYLQSHGMYEPQYQGPIDDDLNDFLLRTCPGRGYPIIEIAKNLFPSAKNRDLYLGSWVSAVACRTTDPLIAKNASSGGVMTALAHHLISSSRVDGAIVTRFDYEGNGPVPHTYVATDLDSLIDAQGSKYCPVPALERLDEFLGATKMSRLVFVGTPCQIAALRLLQRENPELKKRITFTIGNFCGGFRDFREAKKIVTRAGLNFSKVTSFRYRGDGQPGSMKISTEDGRECTLPYPEYVKLTGVQKHYRCRLCVDATAELADFSCGDAWLPKFLTSEKSWSLLIARSFEGSQILEEMEAKGGIVTQPISVSEINRSQSQNLNSKKTRQAARRKFHQFFGDALPEFEGGFPPEITGIYLELKIFIKHYLFSLSEAFGIYTFAAKILGRSVKQ